MKKLATKRRISFFGLLLMMTGAFWILAESNAQESATLLIETDRFTAVQNIKQVHLNEKNGSLINKVGLMNTGGTTLGIGPVKRIPLGNGTAIELVTDLRNTADTQSSVVAGSGNHNQAGTGSLVIGGRDNRLEKMISDTTNSVILGGKTNTSLAQNTAILASSGVQLSPQAQGSVAIGAVNAYIRAKNSAAYAGKNILISSGASESLALGSNIVLSKGGIFAFNAKKNMILTGVKEHTFLINAEHGMIVGTNTSQNPAIQLTISGAVRVGKEACDAHKAGAIFKKSCSSPAGASCLCACAAGNKVESVSNNPACKKVCEGTATSCAVSATCGDRAIMHEAAELNWRPFSEFCGNGSSLA